MPIQVALGDGPLVIALPRSGQHIPQLIRDRMMPDLDLADPANASLDQVVRAMCQDISLVTAQFHPCVCDVNTPDPSHADAPAAERIGVVPTTTRDGHPLWHRPPTMAEAVQWRALFYAPFHAALRAQIARVRARHGYAVLASFQTRHPSQHVAASGTGIFVATPTQNPVLQDIADWLKTGISASGRFTCDLAGPDTTGWITRGYSSPERRIYAVQIEVSADLYMAGTRWCDSVDPVRAAQLCDALRHGFCDALVRLGTGRKPLSGYRRRQ